MNEYDKKVLLLRDELLKVFARRFCFSKKSNYKWTDIILHIDPVLLWPHYLASRLLRTKTTFDWLMNDQCDNYVKSLSGIYKDFDSNLDICKDVFLKEPLVQIILKRYPDVKV